MTFLVKAVLYGSISLLIGFFGHQLIAYGLNEDQYSICALDVSNSDHHGKYSCVIIDNDFFNKSQTEYLELSFKYDLDTFDSSYLGANE